MRCAIRTGKKLRVNQEIDLETAMIIDESGNQLGIMKPTDAMKIAKERGYNLVEVAPNAQPPVCRFIDYGKYLFKNEKRLSVSRKKQRSQNQVKILRYRPNIDEGDYQVKLRNLKKFLQDHYRVEVQMRFRGREMAHKEYGSKVLARISDDISELGEVTSEPKFEGKQAIMVLTPLQNKKIST